MDLGQRLKNARLEAGLSQRQLCGDMITRNMLSQIENGSAKPSMDTLRYLARQLGKSVSFFLEETVPSSNQDLILEARNAFTAGNWKESIAILKGFSLPDPVFEPEFYLLLSLCNTKLAESDPTYLAAAEEAAAHTPYDTPDLHRRRLLLACREDPKQLCRLPDEELLLRARQALNGADFPRCLTLLEEAACKTSLEWLLLRGDCAAAEEKWADAIVWYRQVETMDAYKRLEQCYLQLEDYKMAYFYACKQR
jgi:transcriptional regulator with XRE-family HTH domain